MTRLLKRLRRRGKRTRTWRIAFYNEVGGCEVVEVVRRYRPTRKARALLRPECLRFEIEQVASHVSSQDVGACLLRLSKLASGRVRGVEWWPVGGGLISRPPGRYALRLFVSLPSLLDGRGRWLQVVLWEVRTRRWGRGPAGRGLTLGRGPSISRL